MTRRFFSISDLYFQVASGIQKKLILFNPKHINCQIVLSTSLKLVKRMSEDHRRFKRDTKSSRWLPGERLAIVRKSDKLKSEGEFEGRRHVEEWSPADR